MAENNSALDRPIRLKRLRMRAWHRGMKEMDIILGGFVDAEAASLPDTDLDDLERLMDRQDQQLFLWVSGAIPAPADADAAESAMVGRIMRRFEGAA